MTTGKTPLNYAEVLADLEARRADLDRAIVVIRGLMGQPPPSSAASPETVPGGSGAAGADPQEVRSDSFFGMSIPAASKKYLMMMKNKQSTRQIADALRQGGVHSTSKKFPQMVYNILNRNHDDFVRVGADWALRGWYPHMPKLTKKGGSGAAEEDDLEPGPEDGAQPH